MTKIEQIKQLTSELLQYCYQYYVLDKSPISDKEYDKKFDELMDLENEAGFWLTNSPTRKVQGQVLDCFEKVVHGKPMLSAAKTKDTNEVKKFVGNNEFYCSYKLDGLTLVTIFEDGKFKQAITRGMGLIGEDVTEQAKMISNLPMSIPYKGRLELRGECVISWDQFHKINSELAEPYSHPRNLAAGSLRQLDTNITKQRHLSYVVFECVSDLYYKDVLINSKNVELEHLARLGFETVNLCVGKIQTCINLMKPENYQYPVDGLVFEFDNKSYSKSLPATSHHEGCRIALKWIDDEFETILRDIEWNPTRTGLISPVAIFDEVDLGGALTTRATLHNVSIIENLELGIGDTITIYRSNMVIPKIDDNLTRSGTYKIPNKCPCCGGEAVIKITDGSKFLTCVNPDCSAKKIAQFTHFVSRKCMNIDGLSEKTLEALISHGFIRNFRDIYHLSTYQNKIILLDGFGKKSSEKLLKSIENSRNVALENFIAALGIPTIGSSASKSISKLCNGNFDTFMVLCEEGYDWTQLDDFGKVMANNLNNYLDDNFKELEHLAYEMHFVLPEQNNDNSLAGLKFCITGSFSRPRDELKKELELRGAKFVSSVSKNLDVLFAGDKAGGKLEKAIKFGIKVVKEKELLDMIK